MIKPRFNEVLTVRNKNIKTYGRYEKGKRLCTFGCIICGGYLNDACNSEYCVTHYINDDFIIVKNADKNQRDNCDKYERLRIKAFGCFGFIRFCFNRLYRYKM